MDPIAFIYKIDSDNNEYNNDATSDIQQVNLLQPSPPDVSKEKQLSDLALCKGFESGGGSGRFGRF